MSGYGDGLYGAGVYGGSVGVAFLPNALGPNALLAVEIAWGANLAAAEATWSWTDITSDVRLDPGISTTLGRGDEASAAQPAECTMTLDNTSGRYSLGGQSPNWPNVRRNTPVRVRVDPDGGGFRTVFLGFATGFTPSWNLTGSVRDVALNAAGTLRRLIQGNSPVVSSIRRALLDRTDVVAYWPCEDGKNATEIAVAVGESPMRFTGAPKFAEADAFNASAPLPVVNGSIWTGTVPPHAGTGAVQVRALVDFPPDDEPTFSVVLRVYTSGTAARWDLIYETGFGGLLSMTVYDRFGTQIADTVGVDFNVNEFPSNRRWSVEMVQNGANIDWRWSTLDAEAGGAGYTAPPAVAGYTVGVAQAVVVNPGGTLAKVVVGHVTVQNVQTSIFDDRAELTGNAGDFVTAVGVGRISRLCAENGVALTSAGSGEALSSIADKMGPQPRTTLVELLRECELVDQGTLYDGVSAGLTYTTRRLRENRAADLTISAATAKLAGPFGPVDDDQRTRNRVEAQRTDGSSATVEDTDGPLGTAAVGVYDSSITVNAFQDAAVPLYAGWLVALGTVEGYRYPTLTVDLLATPELAPAWLALRPGFRVDITGVDAILPGHPGGTLSLIVEGLAQEITGTTWTGTAKCSPYQPWRIGTVAAATGDTAEYLARADTSGATVATAAGAGSTALSVATAAAGALWTTRADDYPLALDVGGLQITATACSGAVSPQTFTVPALTAARAAGLPVKVWRAPALGL